MSAVVQARLDEETLAALETLVQEHGMTRSEVLREGIRLVKELRSTPATRKLIGAGMFDSGLGDLSTNKKYMEDFGVKSMGKGWRRPKGRSR